MKLLLRKIYLFVFLSLISSVTIAQNNLPPVFEIKTDTALIDTLPNTYWQILEDKDGILIFEQVSKFRADKFHYNTSGNINRRISTYWIRFTLKNSTNHTLKIGFYDQFIGTSDYYVIKGNRIINHK